MKDEKVKIMCGNEMSEVGKPLVPYIEVSKEQYDHMEKKFLYREVVCECGNNIFVIRRNNVNMVKYLCTNCKNERHFDLDEDSIFNVEDNCL